MQENGELPQISIIVPTYNQGDFLRVCIDSVLSQSYQNWEMIIVNNFSTDHTNEVIHSYSDKRIRSYDFKNLGVIARSRNYAIERAEGEWLAFLDSDDLWYKDKLKNSLQVAIDHGAQAICHAENWIYEDGRIEKKVYGKGFAYDFEQLLYSGNKISTSAVLVKKDLVLEAKCFNESEAMITAEDYYLWLKLMESGVRFYFLEEVLGEYRIHPGGNSQAILRNTKAISHVVESFLLSRQGESFFNMKARRARSLSLYGAARTLQKQRQYWNSLNLLISSILTYPFRLKSYVVFVINLTGLVLLLPLSRLTELAKRS